MTKKEIQIDRQKARKFYELTRETLSNLAKSHGIEESSLEKYYETTDFYYAPNSDNKDWKYAKFLNSLGSSISSVFLQIAAHATNTPRMANIIKFEQNLNFLKEKLCDFNPIKLLDTYKGEERVPVLVNTLRYNIETGTGIKWSIEKSKKHKDLMMTTYCRILLTSAEYLKDFNDREEVIKDLYHQYTYGDYKKLIRYFRKKTTYGPALACDCLKELDKKFSFLCKPDIHIVDTMNAFYGKIAKNAYDYIEEMQCLVEQINAVNDKEQITVYRLDKMIWLICSGNFYLDRPENVKKMYLDKIKNGTYYA